MNNDNHLFDLAKELVLFTDKHVFLTGKAGTGKTTFLREIKETTVKNSAVVAPTGVAAINAGGVTMHSFFQLPFEPFIPAGSFEYSGGISYGNLFKKVRLSSIKRKVMEALELLIIDEVSMLRSDQLDCIDAILKNVRKNNSPFGGVQILFIGDLYQLPPVVTDSDKQILDDNYKSPFFFDARVLQNCDLLHIELKKVYRQKQQHFIDLLNQVRNNTLTDDDLELLHRQYQQGFRPDIDEGYITITSHNYKADAINENALKALEGEAFIYKGVISGDYNEKNLPTEQLLKLKTGAQVMFVKNDSGEDRRYYNGRLATVERASADEITVRMKDDNSSLVLEKEVWKNVRYTLNNATNTLEEEELGSFTQFPIRLAWAITIHKSQGLTFDNVVIDAGQSFAAGQVYVALSRCTSLEGMVLLSQITPSSIQSDEDVVNFGTRSTDISALKEVLVVEKPKWLARRLIMSFDLNDLVNELKQFPDYILTKSLPDTTASWQLATNILTAALETQGILEKFRIQLGELLKHSATHSELKERVEKAAHWMCQRIQNHISLPLEQHIQSLQSVPRVKKHILHCNDLIDYIQQFIIRLYVLEYEGKPLIEQGALDKYLLDGKKDNKPTSKKGKQPKGATYKTTLDMVRKGMAPTAIAVERGLAFGTIESHFARLIGDGELLVTEVLSDEKISTIQTAIRKYPSHTLTDLKKILSDDISFGEIRCVQSHLGLSNKS